MSQNDFDSIDQADLPEKEIEDRSGETLCETCEHKKECDNREGDPHILQAQFFHCHDVVGRADFFPDKDWIISMEVEGKENKKSD